MKVLHLDSSARINRSHTRRLSAMFVDSLRQACPELDVIRRDLAAQTPPHVSEAWIAAAFTPQPIRTAEMREALRISDELVEELLACDLYVFAAPMYNYSVPSVFKSYIDQIVRIGRTFSFDPDTKHNPYRGLMKNKQAILITARGDAGYGPRGPHRAKNHLEPYLEHVLGFLGVQHIETIAVENDEFGGIALSDSLRQAEAAVNQLAAEIAENFCCPA